MKQNSKTKQTFIMFLMTMQLSRIQSKSINELIFCLLLKYHRLHSGQILILRSKNSNLRTSKDAGILYWTYAMFYCTIHTFYRFWEHMKNDSNEIIHWVSNFVKQWNERMVMQWSQYISLIIRYECECYIRREIIPVLNMYMEFPCMHKTFWQS